MEILHIPRGAGKTTKMIEWLRQDSARLLITFSHDEENRLKSLHPDLADRILDWRSYQKRYRPGYHVKEIAIDNADIILQEMFDAPISLITMTEDRAE